MTFVYLKDLSSQSEQGLQLHQFLDMKNIGPKSWEMFNKAGIHDAETIQTMGAATQSHPR